MIAANMDVKDMERSELDLLFGAIAVGDRAGVRRRLAASPELASRAIDTGATRQSESPTTSSLSSATSMPAMPRFTSRLPPTGRTSPTTSLGAVPT